MLGFHRRVALGLATLFCAIGSVHGGTVQTFGGEVYEGDVRLDAGAVNVQLKGQPAQRVDLANILRAELQEKGKGIGDGLNPGVQLRNGTLIGGKVLDIDATAVHLNVGGTTRDFPLATVARVIFNTVPDAVIRKLPAAFVGAILPEGDLYEGECRGMDDKPARAKINSPILGLHRFNVRDGEILAVALHDLTPGSAPEAYRVRATDGSQYSAAAIQLTPEGVTLRDPAAGEVKIGAKQLAQILAGDARVQPLGLMRASAVNSANQAKVPATFSADAMPTGGPITLAGQTYEGGIAQAAGVAVSYTVPVGFSIFSAKIGLPEGAPAGAAVFYSLLADNRPVWRSQTPVAAGAAPVPVRWNLGTGVRTLTLYVEPAQPASLGTPAVWADAMLLKP